MRPQLAFLGEVLTHNKVRSEVLSTRFHRVEKDVILERVAAHILLELCHVAPLPSGDGVLLEQEKGDIQFLIPCECRGRESIRRYTPSNNRSVREMAVVPLGWCTSADEAGFSRPLLQFAEEQAVPHVKAIVKHRHEKHQRHASANDSRDAFERERRPARAALASRRGADLQLELFVILRWVVILDSIRLLEADVAVVRRREEHAPLLELPM
mmetsp:Transcript_43032/g.135040  ORF Transcript_43032/g.135040 Transcript_43032/m.135040 type:complete len:212 (+) Transcript_43032:2105-2740(+)